MANFAEPTNPNFDAIRQIETNDPVLGGAADISGVVNSPVNYALRALVARTQWLKLRVEGISTPAASRATAGIARLASLAQMNAGLNDDTIVTPFLLQQKVNGIDTTPPNASTTQRGIIELLTSAEARAMTDTERALTAALLKDIAQNSTTFRNIIRGLVPVTKVYSGYGVTNATLWNSQYYRFISNSPAGITRVDVPSGETFMGGVAFAYILSTQNGNAALEESGGRIYLKTHNSPFQTSNDQKDARYSWIFWTRRTN